MKYRTLPRTELNISEVSFGLWTVATDWWGKISDADKAALLENALEKGINFFDTADTYGEGFGEEILAKVLGHRRQEFMIATKFGYDFYDKSIPRIGHEPRPQKFDREFVTFACEQSLRRLQTDYIDLYQIHNPKLSHLEMDELFETLEQLQSDGKIRYFGSALGPDIGWFEEGEASMRERHVDSLQIIYRMRRRCSPAATSNLPPSRKATTGHPARLNGCEKRFARPSKRNSWSRMTPAP